MRKPIHKPICYENLKDMLEKSGELYGDKTAYMFKTKEAGKFRKITHKEFRSDINALGTKLIDLGLKDKRIAVISENRYEWGVVYLSVVAGTGVIVPLDKSLPDNEIESLIIRSGVEAIFYSSKYNDIMNKIKEQGNTQLKYFISMDIDKEINGILSQKELISEGRELLNAGNEKFLKADIDNEKMSIMLFTSGTTAMSKAVMLSHKNICANLKDITSVIKLYPEDRFLSFLPLHHTFECTVGFLYPISIGGSIAFCDGIRHIAENIKEYQITAMISVPILFEAMYKKVIKGIEKKGKLETVQKGIKISNALLKIGIDVRKKLFKDIHDTLGGKVRLFVSGGAALDPEAEKGFNDLGFTMYQGYGLTESSPVIAAEDDKYRKIGSIGKAFPSLDVKIDEPNEEGIGELLAKGPSIMLGYYDNEEATKETIDSEGWLHTGDLAKIDKDGYIFISGRKKFVIVLKNGKNIYPEEVEHYLNTSPLISEALVLGIQKEDDDETYINAQIYPNLEAISEYLKSSVPTTAEIKKVISDVVSNVNKKLPNYKHIKSFIIRDKEFEKTTTQKIKRYGDNMKTEEK